MRSFGFGLLLVLVFSARPGGAQTLDRCEGCSEVLAASIRAHLQSVGKRFPTLKRVQVEVTAAVGAYVDAHHDGGKITATMLPEMPPGHAEGILSHELGHAYFSIALDAEGMTRVEEEDRRRDRARQVEFPPEVWPQVRGSCADPYDLAGLISSLHELAADSFAYFVHQRNPTLIAEISRSVGAGESRDRRFDVSLTDEEQLALLAKKPATWKNDPYSALSTCKKIIHESPSVDVQHVIRWLARRYRELWTDGCGKKSFVDFREELRRELAGPAVQKP